MSGGPSRATPSPSLKPCPPRCQRSPLKLSPASLYFIYQPGTDSVLPSPTTHRTDLTCVCTNTTFQQAALSCLQKNCTSAEVTAAQTLQSQECGACECPVPNLILAVFHLRVHSCPRRPLHSISSVSGDREPRLFSRRGPTRRASVILLSCMRAKPFPRSSSASRRLVATRDGVLVVLDVPASTRVVDA